MLAAGGARGQGSFTTSEPPAWLQMAIGAAVSAQDPGADAVAAPTAQHKALERTRDSGGFAPPAGAAQQRQTKPSGVGGLTLEPASPLPRGSVPVSPGAAARLSLSPAVRGGSGGGGGNNGGSASPPLPVLELLPMVADATKPRSPRPPSSASEGGRSDDGRPGSASSFQAGRRGDVSPLTPGARARGRLSPAVTTHSSHFGSGGEVLQQALAVDSLTLAPKNPKEVEEEARPERMGDRAPSLTLFASGGSWSSTDR